MKGKRLFNYISFFCIMALAVLLFGCAEEKSKSSYPGAVLTSVGFDFSVGSLISTDYSDGRIVSLAPPPNATPSGMDSGHLWFYPALNTSTQNYTRDMGDVSLESVTLVPGDWDGGPGVPLNPLTTGHVYIVRCKDGYAKFLVKAIDSDNAKVGVEYSYSSTEAFGD